MKIQPNISQNVHFLTQTKTAFAEINQETLPLRFSSYFPTLTVQETKSY